jgi:hypothetical protein
MINIKDNFLNKDTYEIVCHMLANNKFQQIELGEKKFWVQYSDRDFDNIVLRNLSAIDGKPRESLLAFFRVATDELDTDWRIHADSRVADIIPERALVLYLSESTMEGLHGTAFWKHKKLGYQMPHYTPKEESDRMLMQEANDLSNWELHSVVGYKPNRAVMYPSNYFHSKYPNVGWKEGRMVYVMFYK